MGKSLRTSPQPRSSSEETRHSAADTFLHEEPVGASQLEQRAVVAFFQSHDLFLNRLDALREFKQGLDDLGLRWLVPESGKERVDTGHAGGEGVAGFADLLDGGGAVHEKSLREKRAVRSEK